MSIWRDGHLADPTLIEQVRTEHERQIGKWGTQERTPFEWLAYLTEEVGELAEAIIESEYRGGARVKIRREAIQVATLALKIAEMAIAPEAARNDE